MVPTGTMTGVDNLMAPLGRQLKISIWVGSLVCIYVTKKDTQILPDMADNYKTE